MPRVKCPANCNQGWARMPVAGKPFPKFSQQVKCPTCNGKGTVEGLTPTARPLVTSIRPNRHRSGRPSLSCSVPDTCNCLDCNDQHCNNHAGGCHMRCAKS